MTIEKSGSSSDSESILEFTGERFTPECVREIWYEHWHRYAFALPFAKDRKAIDVASGEGYGTHLLGSVAEEVTGFDIDPASIQHAVKRYAAQPHINYQVASAFNLPLENKSIGVVTSFETLEHLAEQEQMIQEFGRVLSDDGLLIISTPDKLTYSDKTGYSNPDHVSELYQHEFVTLLKQQFPEVHLLGQKMMFCSAIWSMAGARSDVQVHHHLDDSIESRKTMAFEPLYYIAVCSKQKLSNGDLQHLVGLDLFTDAAEAMYAHYNDQVRKNIAFAHTVMDKNQRIRELEEQLARLQTQQNE